MYKFPPPNVPPPPPPMYRHPPGRWGRGQDNNTVHTPITAQHYYSLCEKVNKLEIAVKNIENRLVVDNNGGGAGLAGQFTPELLRLTASLHIYDVTTYMDVDQARWGKRGSHADEISKMIGGLGGVEQIFQLPAKDGKFGVNLIFKNINSKAMAVKVMKSKDKAFYPKVCTKPFPVLQHQMRAISIVLKEMKHKKLIANYVMNEFEACKYGERVIPLISVQITERGRYSHYVDSPTRKLYQNGFIIKTDDTNFTSKEFIQMKRALYEAVLTFRDRWYGYGKSEINHVNIPKYNMYDHVKTALDEKEREGEGVGEGANAPESGGLEVGRKKRRRSKGQHSAKKIKKRFKQGENSPGSESEDSCIVSSFELTESQQEERLQNKESWSWIEEIYITHLFKKIDQMNESLNKIIEKDIEDASPILKSIINQKII